MTIAERRIHWRAIIENQAASGMNVTAYCRESQISTSLFYTWRRKLQEQQAPLPGGFLELIPRRTADGPSGVRIHMGAKLAIEVARGFDPFTLRAVVETLAGHCR